jgi:large repetitive protein
MTKLLRQRSTHFSLLIVSAIALLASSGNPPNGYTAAPFDNNCSSCHGGNNPSGFDGSVTLEGLPGTIVPGTTYPLTLRMTAAAGNPNRGGFQIVVVDGSNNNYGDLTALTANGVGAEFFGSREYVDHRNPKNFSGNGSEISWSFDWKAIGTPAGNTAKFYFIGNFCNGSGSSGDFPKPENMIVPVDAPANITAEITGTTNVSCFGGNNGNATAAGSGGSGTYTYLWSNGQTAATAINLIAGNYTVTVTASGGGTGTAMANISQPTSALTALTMVGGSITCASSTTSITANANGGTPSYTYLWSNGSNDNPLSVNAAATYTVTVTDGNNCTKTATAVVSSNTIAPVAVATGSTQSCTSNSTTVSGTGSSTGANFAYLWTAPLGGNIIAGGSTINATVSGAGTYTLQVTNNANGCTKTATAVVSSPTPPVVSTSGTTLSCTNPTGLITASAVGNVSYSWSGPSFNSNLQNPSVSQPGTYTVTVTSLANGCTATATATVISNIALPSLSVSTTTATCTNPLSNATATSNVAAQYNWTWPGGGNSTQATIPLSPGIVYTVVATNPSNGCTSSSTATYSGNTTPPSASTVGGTLTCSISQITVPSFTNATNPTYAWAGAGISSGNNTSSITVNVPGTYTVTITNSANGCTNTSTATVSQDITPPNVAIAPPTPLTCNSPTVMLNGTNTAAGTFSYQWAGPMVVSGANTLSPTVSASGLYTLTATNTTNSCTSTSSATVQQSSAVVVSISSSSNVSCFGGSNGTASPITSGGLPPYSFLWNNTSTTATITGLAPGGYILTVTDGGGCTGTAAVQIIQPVAPLVVNASATAITGAGQNNGTATANPSGGTSPYTYLWSNNAITQTIENLSAGVYTVTVLDNNGCSSFQTVNVSAFNCSFTATIQSTNVSCNGQNNGTATVTVGNANNPIVYQWSNQAFTSSVSNLAPGTYTVTATDATNCPVILSVTISQPPALVVSVSTTNVTAIGATDGTATVNANGGTAPFSYLWSNGSTLQTANNLAAGTYTVTVTDNNGCTNTQNAFINAFNCTGVAALNATNASCAGVANGSINALYIGGQSPITYLWSNSQTTQSITGITAGVYTVIMTDATGCALLDTAIVTEPAPLVAEIASITNVTCPNQQAGFVVINVTGGGTAPYSFNFPSAGQNLLAVGVYTTTVTNSNGCTTLANFSIIALDTVPPIITCPSNIVQCDSGFSTNFDLPNVVDNCLTTGIQYAIIQGQPNNSYFPAGTTTQVYRVTDNAGNSSTCSFTITTYPLPDVQGVLFGDDLNNTGVGFISITPVGGTPPFTFDWKKDNQPFATTEDLTGLFAGKYALTMKDASGCETTLSVITIDNVVNTTTPFQSAGIRLWPNPVMNEGLLNIEMNNIEPVSLLIMNNTGQTMVTQQQFDAVTQVDLSKLTPGIYFTILVDKQGQRYYASFVKQQ